MRCSQGTLAPSLRERTSCSPSTLPPVAAPSPSPRTKTSLQLLQLPPSGEEPAEEVAEEGVAEEAVEAASGLHRQPPPLREFLQLTLHHRIWPVSGQGSVFSTGHMRIRPPSA